MHGMLAWYRDEASKLVLAQKAANQDAVPIPNGACPQCGSVSVSSNGVVMVGENAGEGKRCGQCGHGWSVAR